MNHLQKCYEASKLVVLVNNNLCEKLFSSLESPTTSDYNFKVTSAQFSVPDFNLSSC